MNEYLVALCGGGLIGLAASLFLVMNGQVTGMSGIIAKSIGFASGPRQESVFLILGLASGGLFFSIFFPEALNYQVDYSLFRIALAGLMVGYGTRLGNGCTSGHGVCGLSRLSLRSLVATLTFMASGVLTVAAFKIIDVMGSQ